MQCVLLLGCALYAQEQPRLEGFLSWSSAQAEAIGKSTIAKGRVGGSRRLLNTETSLSYKLRATWLTPEVIRACARQQQLRGRLTDEQTLKMVLEAEAAGETTVMVDLDPDEGSGVIPLDWGAYFGPKGKRGEASRGVLRDFRASSALNGVERRNYDYDRFWIVFPLANSEGKPLFRDSDHEAQLVVRIQAKEEEINWVIPDSIRARVGGAGRK